MYKVEGEEEIYSIAVYHGQMCGCRSVLSNVRWYNSDHGTIQKLVLLNITVLCSKIVLVSRE